MKLSLLKIQLTKCLWLPLHSDILGIHQSYQLTKCLRLPLHSDILGIHQSYLRPTNGTGRDCISTTQEQFEIAVTIKE